MNNSLFYNHIENNDNNKHIIQNIKEYAANNPTEQFYLITAPLSENKYSYEYEQNVIVIASPKHKVIFLNLNNGDEDFEEYYDDFMEDLSSISDKFKYKKHIGRPRKWKDELTIKEELDDNFNFEELLDRNVLPNDLRRKSELLISLLIGSINDIEKVGLEIPKSLLEKTKHNIILFDGEQTRFIYKKIKKKRISIQGLSGTGKTELLLHKLKEIYSSEDHTKIFFTCHNIALSNTLRDRIPDFFDFMKVEKQIQWDKQLWVNRAWGSQRDKNSGLYSYICDFYGIPFSRWSRQTTYKDIFTAALTELKKIKDCDFKFAFDYILIDEKQDFPDVFFELCEKITKKNVYIAGDIFQDIFDNNIQQKVVDVDFILNKCYRTAPRILMFAHALGMGLFEEKKLNWLEDLEWEASGYTINKNNKEVTLHRDSIRRFEDLEEQNISSMNVEKYSGVDQVIDIIKKIQKENSTLVPDDIAIIVLDTDSGIYNYIDGLEFKIKSELQWGVNKSYESKEKIKNTLFISNINNVKGLEFPFVICITNKIKSSYIYRNSLYTMLTRSFLQSYLLVNDFAGIECQLKGLEVINESDCIKTIEPSEAEKAEIRNTIIKIKKDSNISFYDFLNAIFDDLDIEREFRKKFVQSIPEEFKSDFDRDGITEFISANKKFYCK
jgi:superfamily I DNA and RNA helicase